MLTGYIIRICTREHEKRVANNSFWVCVVKKQYNMMIGYIIFIAAIVALVIFVVGLVTYPWCWKSSGGTGIEPNGC